MFKIGIHTRPMKEEEFIRRLLDPNGSRDLSDMVLEEGCELYKHPEYKKIREYFFTRNDELKSRPFNFENARFRYVKAPGLYLPYLNAPGADFKGAVLRGAYLTGGNFEEAIFEGANLIRVGLTDANLEGAYLVDVDFEDGTCGKANLQKADVSGMNCKKLFMGLADLRGVIGLDKARNLCSPDLPPFEIFGQYEGTIVTPRERDIIAREYKSYRDRIGEEVAPLWLDVKPS